MKLKTGTISKKELENALKKESTLMLATCADNRVTIRPMSHVSDGLDIWFQAGIDSLKIQQISVNPLVALGVGTYEIEGTATLQGHPLAAENELFAKKYRRKHPGSFMMYSNLPEEVVIHVQVHRVRQWRYVKGKPCLAKAEFM